MCAYFCYKMVHCGIFGECIVGFVKSWGCTEGPQIKVRDDVTPKRDNFVSHLKPDPLFGVLPVQEPLYCDDRWYIHDVNVPYSQNCKKMQFSFRGYRGRVEFFSVSTEYIYIFYHLPKMGWHRQLKSFLVEDKVTFILRSGYHGREIDSLDSGIFLLQHHGPLTRYAKNTDCTCAGNAGNVFPATAD